MELNPKEKKNQYKKRKILLENRVYKKNSQILGFFLNFWRHGYIFLLLNNLKKKWSGQDSLNKIPIPPYNKYSN